MFCTFPLSSEEDWHGFRSTTTNHETPDPIPQQTGLLPKMNALDERDEIATVRTKKKTILVIDDQSDMGWIMSRIFGDRGGKVITSRSGKEGLRKLNERKGFDLVFLDIKLPDLNGFEVLEQIKKASPDTKVIIITAFGSPEARQEALERGAAAFLDKPIQIDEMTRLADEVLSKS